MTYVLPFPPHSLWISPFSSHPTIYGVCPALSHATDGEIKTSRGMPQLPAIRFALGTQARSWQSFYTIPDVPFLLLRECPPSNPVLASEAHLSPSALALALFSPVTLNTHQAGLSEKWPLQAQALEKSLASGTVRGGNRT